MSATRNPVPLSPDQIRAGFHKLARERQTARGQYLDFSREEAEAEHKFRKTRAVKFAEARSMQMSVQEADIYARAEAADHELERNLAHSKAKAALLRIDEVEAERSSLRHLSDREEREAG